MKKFVNILFIFWLFVNICGLLLAVASRDILSFSGCMFAFVWSSLFFFDNKE